MSYTATSVEVFIAAFSGALEGMQGLRYPPSADPLRYAHVTKVALAYAQAFDTAYAVVTPNELQIDNIVSASEGAFAGRLPGSLAAEAAAFFTAMAASVVAIVHEADVVFAAGVTNPVPTPAVAGPLVQHGTATFGIGGTTTAFIPATITNTTSITFGGKAWNGVGGIPMALDVDRVKLPQSQGGGFKISAVDDSDGSLLSSARTTIDWVAVG